MTHAPDETWITVVGRTAAINTGFVSAIEAEGWRYEEVADVLALLAQPLPPRTLIVVPIETFSASVYALVSHLTTTVALPVVVCSPEHSPSVINTTLAAGADDYLPLPVTIEEMIARLSAVIRVRFGAQDETYRSDYRLDEAAQTVAITGGTPIHLSVSEFRLFRMLFAARNRPVSRERLTTIPMPHSETDGQNALDATVSRLRRKVGAERILTIRGTGYQLVDFRQTPSNISYMHDAIAAR